MVHALRDLMGLSWQSPPTASTGGAVPYHTRRRPGVSSAHATFSAVTILPDHLAPGLRVVFCGTAVGTTSASRGHYYAGPGNEFWTYLHEAGLTPRRLRPEEDAQIVEFGIGLTDLAKGIASSYDPGLRNHYDVDDFTAKIERFGPRWVAFHGKTAAKEVSHVLSHGRSVKLGRQPWTIGRSSVFVVPSASASNRDPSRLEGRSSRLAWFRELAELVPAAAPRG